MSDPLETFIDHWSRAEASERANSQSFLCGLADLLGVPRPSNSHHDGYSFEYPVRIPRGDGTTTPGFLDLYRRGCFVLESKQFVAPNEEQTPLQLLAEEAGLYNTKKKSGPVRGSEAWDEAMFKARGQAERYARSLPAEEPSPPFLLIVDVGHSIEIFADFTQAGKAYLPFPDPRGFRIRLADLRDEKIRERLRRIWLEPFSLDPTKHSAAVTRKIAEYLATLAKSLEEAGHAPRLVAEFLTRCLFCMFAEDVGLLPKDGFRTLLESLRGSPDGFVPKLRMLFAEMQTGTDFSVILNRKLLRFNGGLFEDASVLPVDGTQLGILILAAQQEWKEVEPAIFGTLLERALDPTERHQLGAHYTPRAYVERLVLPTVIEPLRAEWETVRAAALLEAKAGRIKKARAEIIRFHTHLCEVRVLDPACGSGNFLYVTLEHLKRLEGEVLDAAAAFGETLLLDLSTHTVDPHQFLGIELNPRAAAVAEMVLWIGYLQWHFRTRGQTMPEEPVLKKFRNIECRDAVLAWDGEPQPVTWGMALENRKLPGVAEALRQDDDAVSGAPPPDEILTLWDRRSFKTDLLTGRNVPDESKRVPLLAYPKARPAEWPKADFIVGNPPFLGKVKMREDFGHGYVETLRAAYPEVPESVDFVMYWWHKAALLTSEGGNLRFGLITTNSLRQTFNRRVVQRHLDQLSLVFVIPDHPWVDATARDERTAAVRIAMTVGTVGNLPGDLHKLITEETNGDGSYLVTFSKETGRIAADLTIGADIAGTVALKANEGMSTPGVKLHGSGFIVTPQMAVALGLGALPGLEEYILPYRNGKDLNDSPRGVLVIDLHGLSQDEVRQRFPAVFQHVLTTVKPERDQNNEAYRRENWWLFGRKNTELRASIRGLSRYIATVETSKYRTFQFLDGSIRPDNKLVVIGSDDAFHLGVLSSRIHVVFALGCLAKLGPTPVYPKSECFDPFPFPACDEPTKTRIRALAENLDAHRKRVQAQHPGLSLTAMYNVLEAIRAGRSLTAKEQAIHDNGLVSVLRQLHDELDAAVAAAYGWPADLPDAEILTRLVSLNAQRVLEEASGTIRWLRPDYQNPPAESQSALDLSKGKQRASQRDAPTSGRDASMKRPTSKTKTPWPKTLAERVRVVDAALQGSPVSVTADLLAKRFARAKPEDIAEILETLATLGRAQYDGKSYSK